MRITAQLPGMRQDDIDVSVDDGILTLSGEKKDEGVVPAATRCERVRPLPRLLDDVRPARKPVARENG